MSCEECIAVQPRVGCGTGCGIPCAMRCELPAWVFDILFGCSKNECLCPPCFALSLFDSSIMKTMFLIIYHRILVALPSATIIFISMCIAATLCFAQAVSSKVLRFNRDIITRYSFDHLPRSLSIRQGADVRNGYDPEGAKLCKLWRAPASSPVLEKSDCTVRSIGCEGANDGCLQSEHERQGCQIEKDTDLINPSFLVHHLCTRL